MPAKSPAELLAPDRPLTLANVADGAEGLVISDLARAVAARPNPPAISALVICRDGPRMAALARALSFFSPDIAVLQFPAWDCQPYDRVSPHGGMLAQRMTALARLSRAQGQRQAADRAHHRQRHASARAGARPDRQAGVVGRARPCRADGLVSSPGWSTTATTAPRPCASPANTPCAAASSICFRPVSTSPCGSISSATRWKSIRTFDRGNPAHAAGHARARSGSGLGIPARHRNHPPFRMGYVAAFGATERDDLLYEAVSEGRRHPGMEHWLPLFHERMDTLFDYLDGAPVAIEPQGEDAARERLKQIADYYEARREALEHPGSGAIYKPLPPDRLYLPEDEWTSGLTSRAGAADAVRRAGRQRRCVRRRRAAGPQFYAGARRHRRQRVRSRGHARAGAAGGGQERGDRAVERGLPRPDGHVLADHGRTISPASTWRTVLALPRNAGRAGGARPGRRVRDRRCRRHQRAGHPGRPAGAAAQGQPQARTISLPKSRALRPAISWFMSITASAASSACRTSRPPARRMIAWNCTTPTTTKLFLPVENIELLSRYGSEDADVELDRLGGTGWQARKAH